MKPFALIGLLVPIVAGSWWLYSLKSSSVDEGGEVQMKVEADGVSEVDTSPETTEKLFETTPAKDQVVVYDGISVSRNATKLDLSGKGLSGSLKAEVRQLSELRELDISNNEFTGLPAEVGQLTKLEKLDLSNNPLTGLPHELGNLHDLQQLNLRGTQYSKYDLDIIKAGLSPSVQILTD